ncbi:MAG: ATP-binding protein [Desulfobacterales bacterium]
MQTTDSAHGLWPHPATGLGMEACKHGIRTRFVTGCGLVNELIEARDEKLLARAVKRYAGYGLLIIDELGYVPFSKEGAQLIFFYSIEIRSLFLTSHSLKVCNSGLSEREKSTFRAPQNTS